MSKITFSILAFLSFFYTSYSQQKFDVNRDIDLVPVFERVVEDGYGTVFIYNELANEYYFRNNYEKAKLWFEKLFDEEPPVDETLLYRYKQSLKALGTYSDEQIHLIVEEKK